MKNLFKLIALLCISQNLGAQCGSNVPTIVIDLSANPDTTWILSQANAPDRLGQCCGVSTNQECIQFEITLHPNSAGMLFDYDGAGAYGSLSWSIDCGPANDMRDTICVSDSGPFTLTFCKPGADNGNYTLITISKPTFPDDQTVPLNCVLPLEILGVNADSPTWQSISPGAPGEYNHLLSCTDCLTPIFTPSPDVPSEIEYRICGYPILDFCVGYYNYCDTMKITILDSLLLSVSPNPAAFCSGSNVTLTAQATGGDGNYNYFWYNSSMDLVGTGSTLDVNTAGNYTCEVRDGNFEPGFCDDFFESVMVEESSMPFADVSNEQILCATSPNASISGTFQNASGIVWSGGTGTFQNGNNEIDNTYIPSIADIENGSVILTMTTVGAGNGCDDVAAQMQLFFVDTIEIDLTDVTDFNGYEVSCYGKQNGEINAQVSGGVAPYTYEWNNGAVTSGITNLGSGSYTITVTDIYGCSSISTVELTQPDSLSVTIIPSNVSCNGGNDGLIDVTVSGGIEPYIYSWSNGQDSEDIATLSPGDYMLTITDANDCALLVEQEVVAPTILEIKEEITSVTCYGFADGAIDISCFGGTAPYAVQWSNGSSTEDISELESGLYEAIISDSNGCWIQVSIYISQPEDLIIDANNTNPTCFEESDGQINVSVSGGTAPFEYVWSNGSQQENISDLTAGTYSLTIVDSNKCVYNQSFTLTQPDALDLELTSPVNFHNHNITMNGGNDGSINVDVDGGTEAYTYSWSNGSTSPNQNNLTAGVYYLTVEDAQGCRIMDTIVLTEPDILELPTIFTPNEDGQNDAFDIHGIEAYPNNILTVVNRWGNVVYEEEKYHNTWKGTHFNGEELPDGVYFVILKINNGDIERNSYVHIKKH